MNKLPLTNIEIESRTMFRLNVSAIFVGRDPQPGWVRTYKIPEGWQRYPIEFIEEYTVPLDPREAIVLSQELKAKGYSCMFVTNILSEQLYYNTMDELEKETYNEKY